MGQILLILVSSAILAAGLSAATNPKFGSREDYTGLYTEVAIIADVNNDGNPDLVGVLGGVVHILLGDGKGDFQPAPDQNLAASDAYRMTAVDLNRDGVEDLLLLTVNGNYGGVTASLGLGDGTFDFGTFYPAQSGGHSPSGMAVGDFDNDGKTDVVVSQDSGLYFLAGNGDGSFQPPTIAASIQPGSTDVTAADLNGDGNLDLIVNLGAAGPNGLGVGFQIYYGNGNGTFQAPISFSQPQRAERVVTGSLYRGGPPAIVMTTSSSPYAWVFVNDGKGNFSAPHYAYLPGDDGLALGDMDNDGYTDLISSLGYVAYGAAGATFPTTKYYPVFAPGSSAYTVAVGDLTNNGKLDIVTDSNFGISVVFNKGKRLFLEGNWTPVTGGSDCAASGDFNRDGRTDLAVINASAVSILLGTGSAAKPWTVGTTLPLANAGCPVVGDLNGDGVPDLLVPTPSGAVTFLGKGDGMFTETSTTLTSAEGYLVIGDFNHDGKLDFASSANLLAYGKGNGTFGAPKAFVSNPPDGGFSNIAVGDINKDGWLDLALTSSIIEGNGFNVYSMLNNHAGGFTYVDAGVGAETIGIVLADLNGDGILDMALEELSSSGAAVYFGDGQGHFRNGVGLPGPSPEPGTNAIADFNGDGIPDVATLSANSVSVYPGIGGGAFGSALSFGAGYTPAFMVPVNILRPAGGFADLAFPDTSGGLTTIFNITK